MISDFKSIYKEGSEWADHLICNHCGERVERGIFNVSHHWMHCEKRTDDLIIASNDFEKKLLDHWSINIKPLQKDE
jgi:hypothetical protein